MHNTDLIATVNCGGPFEWVGLLARFVHKQFCVYQAYANHPLSCCAVNKCCYLELFGRRVPLHVQCAPAARSYEGMKLQLAIVSEVYRRAGT